MTPPEDHFTGSEFADDNPERVTLPPATRLIYRHHDDDDRPADAFEDGMCCFCGHEGRTVPAADAISQKYFSNDDLMDQPNTGRVCDACSFCMSHGPRGLKQGHWLASADTYERVSTGDLPDVLRGVRAGAYDPPLAIHVSDNPIRSEHAYFWTPTNPYTSPLVVSYDDRRVAIDWGALDQLVADIERLRRNGFRLDDIRAGEPRVRNLDSLGSDAYRRIDERIDPHRRTALFECAITLSRAGDDQPADHNPTPLATNA